MPRPPKPESPNTVIAVGNDFFAVLKRLREEGKVPHAIERVTRTNAAWRIRFYQEKPKQSLFCLSGN